MHNVGFTFDYNFCPYCMAESVEQYDSLRREEITGILRFQPKDIIMCVLHVKQRLVENTLGYMASAAHYKDIILENLRKLSGLENFNWREFKQRVTEEGITTTSFRTTVKSSMLSGDACNIILKNIGIVVECAEQTTKAKYFKIFELLRNIIIICEMHQDSAEINNKLTEKKIEELEQLILDFLVTCFGAWHIGIKSHYFHYLIHIPNIMIYLWKMDLSLSIVSNQGFERSHLFHHAVFNRIMNNGGGRNAKSNTEQLLLWQWRKVFLAIELQAKTNSTYWGEKREKQAYSWSKDKKKKRIDLFELFNNNLVSNNETEIRDCNQLMENITIFKEQAIKKQLEEKAKEKANQQPNSNNQKQKSKTQAPKRLSDETFCEHQSGSKKTKI